MKTTNICLDYSPVYGGVVQAIRDFQTALGGRILSFDDGLEERSDEAAVHYIDENSRFMGKRHQFLSRHSRRKAEQFICDQNPELLVTHSLFRGQCNWTRQQAKREDIPYWAVPHGSLDPWVFSYGGKFKHWWMRLVGERYLRDASAVVFATERERTKAAHIYSGDNTKVVHWPVEMLDISLRAEARLDFRKKWGISEDERILMYLGRYDGMKRPLETIEAFARAKADGVRLVLVGGDSGLRKSDLEAYVADRSLSDSVLITGPIYGPARDSAFLAADGFISLSHRENFGYTTAEALSASLPVILSPGNDLSFDLVNQDCGWCLSSNDLEEAVDAIQGFSVTEPSALEAMGQKGRFWCESHLSMNQFVSNLNTLYVL